jgi:hypothetical protein
MLGFTQLSRALDHSFSAIANIAEAADNISGLAVVKTAEWQETAIQDAAISSAAGKAAVAAIQSRRSSKAPVL